MTREYQQQHDRHNSATIDAAGTFITTGGHVVLGKMRWRTPKVVVERIALRMRLPAGFDLDAAAEDGWHHGRRWFTAEQDCLVQDWPGDLGSGPVNKHAFINPPWGAAGLPEKVKEIAAIVAPGATIKPFPGTAAFVRAAWNASRLGMTVAVLVPQVFDSDWMRGCVALADELWIGNRIRFEDFTGAPGPQPPGGHALLVYRPHVPVEGWPGGPRVDWRWQP